MILTNLLNHECNSIYVANDHVIYCVKDGLEVVIAHNKEVSTLDWKYFQDKNEKVKQFYETLEGLFI